MPVYLEIEGKSKECIQKALEILSSQNKCSLEGKWILIQNKFGLNWYDMEF